MKDTWAKPKRGRIKGGEWGLLGWWGSDGEKWRQLYLSNNKTSLKKVKKKKEMESQRRQVICTEAHE